MKFSRNPNTGILECYTDDGVYIGNMSTMGDENNKHSAEDANFIEEDHPRDENGKIKAEDDSSDLEWITMNGSHIPIDPDSNRIVGGAHGKFNGRRVNAYTDGPGYGIGNQKNENSTSGGKNEPGKKAESSKENKGKLYGGSWNNKEEYLEARKKAEEDYQKKSKEIDQKRKDFKNEEARINSDAEKEKEEISKKMG